MQFKQLNIKINKIEQSNIWISGLIQIKKSFVKSRLSSRILLILHLILSQLRKVICFDGFHAVGFRLQTLIDNNCDFISYECELCIIHIFRFFQNNKLWFDTSLHLLIPILWRFDEWWTLHLSQIIFQIGSICAWYCDEDACQV